jgi:hypothetical protein
MKVRKQPPPRDGVVTALPADLQDERHHEQRESRQPDAQVALPTRRTSRMTISSK